MGPYALEIWMSSSLRAMDWDVFRCGVDGQNVP